MRRSPLSIARSLADVLSTLPEGETFTINEAKGMAGIHWLTASAYLRLFQFIQTAMPRVRVGDGSVTVERLAPDWLELRSEHPEAFVLAKILRFLNRTKEKDSSTLSHSFSVNDLRLSEEETRWFQDLAEAGLVQTTKDGKYLLTKDAAGIADEAIEKFLVPSENLLTGVIDLKFQSIPTQALERALERARLGLDKARFENHELSVQIESLRGRLSLSEHGERGPRQLGGPPIESITPLETFYQEALFHLRNEPSLENLAQSEGISELTLTCMASLRSALERDKSDFEVFVMKRPEGSVRRRSRFKFSSHDATERKRTRK